MGIWMFGFVGGFRWLWFVFILGLIKLLISKIDLTPGRNEDQEYIPEYSISPQPWTPTYPWSKYTPPVISSSSKKEN